MKAALWNKNLVIQYKEWKTDVRKCPRKLNRKTKGLIIENFLKLETQPTRYNI